MENLDPTFDKCLENSARGLCKARGQDPDELVPYDNGTLAFTRRMRWKSAKQELYDAWLLNMFVRTLP
jgi:hypothetical protein